MRVPDAAVDPTTTVLVGAASVGAVNWSVDHTSAGRHLPAPWNSQKFWGADAIASF